MYDPATGRATAEVALADRATVAAAVASAQAAWPAWRQAPPLKRARVMSRRQQLLERDAQALCALITREHGKVLADSLGELQRGRRCTRPAAPPASACR